MHELPARCEDDVIGYRTARSAAGEHDVAGPDAPRLHRVARSGLVTVPVLRLSNALGMNWNPRLIRPPGSLSEKEFLKRCIKCGQCMRICPTNIIQPAGLGAGVEALWTPTLNFRIGTSGCQLNCVACGNVCPTAAIRPHPLDEKMGRGNSRPGVPSGSERRLWIRAAACRGRWTCRASSVRKIVPSARRRFTSAMSSCRSAKNCRLSPKPTNCRWISDRPSCSRDNFRAGDFFCRVSARDEEPRRIVDNAATGITIGATKPWDPPPKPGRRVEILIRLQRPFVDPSLCIGCGICEHECPSRV